MYRDENFKTLKNQLLSIRDKRVAELIIAFAVINLNTDTEDLDLLNGTEIVNKIKLVEYANVKNIYSDVKKARELSLMEFMPNLHKDNLYFSKTFLGFKYEDLELLKNNSEIISKGASALLELLKNKSE